MSRQDDTRTRLADKSMLEPDVVKVTSPVLRGGTVSNDRFLPGEVWTGIKVKVVVDRETGEIIFNNNRFRLEIRDDKAFLYYQNAKTPLFTGYLRYTTWFFEEDDTIRDDEDPYVAAIQTIYEILQLC